MVVSRIPKKILFISHEASRTGAPIVLLHFLRWLKVNTDIPFIILLKKSGELYEDFEALAPTYVYNHPYNSYIGIKGGLLEKWNSKIRIPDFYKHLKEEFENHSIGLIYSNTILNGEILDFLSFLKCKVITHVHELEYAIYCNGQANIKHVKKYTHHYIAASKAVKENLIVNHFIKEDSINIIHEFINNIQENKVDNNTLRSSLNISENAFIIGASGSADLRKGFDLSASLIKKVYELEPNGMYHFVWVGVNQDDLLVYTINGDIKKLGLSRYVHFIDKQENPFRYYSIFDVFVLLSREDPFPLVCLESAALSKPIICFDESGGMPEFIEEDCGFVVPYLDISMIAHHIVCLQKNPSLKESLGKKAENKVKEKYHIESAANKILDIIEKYLNI